MEFEIGGVKIAIQFSFFAVLLLMTQFTGSDWVLWCTACCLLHEAGHLAAYSLCGACPRALCLGAGGMRIVPPHRLFGFWRELLVLSGGVLVNFSLAGLLLGVGLTQAAAVSLFLAGFNLLPLAPLDGGQILRLLLEKCLPIRYAQILARTVHWVTWGVLAAAGLLLCKKGNFTLLLTLICLSQDKK